MNQVAWSRGAGPLASMCYCGECPWVAESRSDPYLPAFILEMEAAGEPVPCEAFLVRTGPLDENDMEHGRRLAEELGL